MSETTSQIALAASPEAEILAALGARMIVLVGMMGAGKSTIGRRLAARLRLPFMDADTEIETAHTMPIPEIFEKYGEPYFRDGEARVIARLLNSGPGVLATGGGSFLREETRQRIGDKAVSIWLKADIDVIMKRVKRRTDRPLLQTEDPAATVSRLLFEREPVYQQADLTIASRDVPHERIVDECIQALYQTVVRDAQAFALRAPLPPPEIPEAGPGPQFVIRDDGVIDFAPPSSLDSSGNNISRLRSLHPTMCELIRSVAEALGRGNVAHKDLFDRAQNYRVLIDRELHAIPFAQLYVEGLRLENAWKAANEKIAEKELPSLSASTTEELATLLSLHGTFMLSTADGLALLGLEERYQRGPGAERDLREALSMFSRELTGQPHFVASRVATFIANTTDGAGQGKYPERSAVAAVSTTKNIAVVMVSGAVLGAFPFVGNLVAGEAGAIGAGAITVVGLAGLRNAKSFLAISGLVTKGFDNLSEIDLQRIIASNFGKLAPWLGFVLKMEPTLRRLASERDEFGWLATSLDWLKKQTDRSSKP